jgi:hypothetical protein
MLTYTYLTQHIVLGPQSFSYFIPIILLPITRLIPRAILSKWQSICLFMPLMVASTIHAWTQMGGVDVICVDILLWALYLLVLKDPWKDFLYVGLSNGKQDDTDVQNGEMAEVRPYPSTLSERIPWVRTLLISIGPQGWKIEKHSHDVRQRPINRTTTRAAFTKQTLLGVIRGYLVLDLTCSYQTYDSYFTNLNTSISSLILFSKHTVLLLPRLFRSGVMGAQVWTLIRRNLATRSASS